MAKKPMKIFSTSLVIKEMQIKTKLRDNTSLLLERLPSGTQTTTNAGQDVESSYTATGNVN
jgi:hypothetical protein